MPTADLRCWNCGAGLDAVPRPISRHEQCAACFEALHCCRMCRHYRKDATGQCDEERSDPPVIKENANFCDWFSPSADAFNDGRANRAGAARDRLDALFGDQGAAAADHAADDEAAEPYEATPEETARARLDELFGKE